MKRILILTPLLLLLFAACKNSSKSTQTLLTAKNLKSTFITLDAMAAYTLKTPKGAIIKIPAHAFIAGNASKVQLEFKEAYSLQDIIMAGLKTESNGNPLQSGGMFYINATADGKALELLKPIKISIPTNAYDDNMELFKGQVESDSTINWVDPQPLDTGLTAKKLLLGERLFKANCSSCHKPNKDFTGPALAGCRDRAPSREWPYRFVVDCNRMYETDPYAKALVKKWGSKQMQFILSKEDIHAIFDYCDNRATLIPPINLPDTTTPMPVATKPATPCGFDTVYYNRADTGITIIPDDTTVKQTAFPDSGAVADFVNEFSSGTESAIPLDFTDESSTGGMYDISIKALGWYNLDVFLKAYPALTAVKLKVQLQTPIESGMNVFLFCPGKRLLTEANSNDGNIFSFADNTGTISLALTDKAVILAFGSKGDKMFYGTASFNIKTEQLIPITVKETTEAALKSFILKNNIDGITIDLNKKEDFEIRQKPCDGMASDTSAEAIINGF
ncbi:c-type cytochrome [Ferruginibacter sp. SUN106]|uniref:c-type cytochrome n=1 Tax=Ferruginibacter sp. SUN106 TaxID=2978348 RepID=UPI003D3692C1